MSAERPLWQPGPGPRLASPSENARVRSMLAVDLEERCGKQGITPGQARGEFARDWVLLARKEGLHSPGADQRAHAPEGADVLARHIDAAKTRLRQFQACHNELAWVLAGIEAVVCDRAGMALPREAYQTQGKLPV